MILQKTETQNYRVIQVEKNRFDGEVGQQGMAFDKNTKRYFELNKVERELFIKEEGDIQR